MKDLLSISRLFLYVLVLSLAFTAIGHGQKPCRFPKGQNIVHLPDIPQGCEVNVAAEVWGYDRIYPLLDGLFQDVASTNIKSLILDPNASNATNLDALTQSLQIQAGFNQLAGVQNSVAAQMAVANLGYQSTVAQQSQSILQQQVAAQQQLYQAQQTLNTVTQGSDSNAIAKAQQAVQAASSNVTNLASQMALITQPTTPFTPAGAANPIATAITSTPTSAIPTAVQGTGAASGGPSFPATKQLDNQVDLLWSRLARVVGAMTESDSLKLKGGHIHLVEFNTSTFPGSDRKNRLLDTTYHLSCGADSKGAASTNTDPPTIVDMFPRVAAINITDTRYKDQSFNLGAIFAFFTFGVNASYNREHLKMSQSLGQASYITGYGVGMSDFGWKYGIPLGDKIITSDVKRTFALIHVPEGCNAKLQMNGIWWSKANKTPIADGDTLPVDHFSGVEAAMESSATPVTNSVKSITFNRTSYDPTKYSAANPASVSLVLTMEKALDPQVLIYANGILIKRARDSFGRAITSGGSGGLLETNSLSSVNTWIPTSSRSILMTLDGAQFGSAFPTILVVPPTKDPPTTVGPNLASGVTANITGKDFTCSGATCPLPSLAYKLPKFMHIGVSRKQGVAGKIADKVFFTVADAIPTSTAAAPAPHSSVQIISGSSQQMWGANVEVYVSTPNAASQKRIQCDPTNDTGGRLLCELTSDAGLTIKDNVALHIIDLGHRGGPIEGWTQLATCTSDCFPPTVWDIDNPGWVAHRPGDKNAWGHWEVRVSFVNVDNTLKTVTLERQTPANLVTKNGISTAKIVIDPEQWGNLSDSMDLGIDTYTDQTWKVLNIQSLITPTASHLALTATSVNWFGTNMVPDYYKQLVVKSTPATSPVPIGCLNVNSCTGTTGMPSGGGTLYLAYDNASQQIPLMQLDATTGLLSPVVYTPPKPEDKIKAGAGGAANPVQQTATPAKAGINPLDLTNAEAMEKFSADTGAQEFNRNLQILPTQPEQ